MTAHRYIVTIATRECEEGLRRIVGCLKKLGWQLDSNPVIVFTSDFEWSPEIGGISIRRLDGWWKDVEELVRCRNAPALLKPFVFLDPQFKDGDLVLYLDSADIMIFRNPGLLFDQFDSSNAVIGARPFRLAGHQVHRHPSINRLLSEFISDPDSGHVNSGVVLMRICATSKLAMHSWQFLLGYAALSGPWRLYNLVDKERRVLSRIVDSSRRVAKRMGRKVFPRPAPVMSKSLADIVGDQQPFNVVFRMMERARLTYEIPARWHYLGSLKVALHLKVRNGAVFDEKGEPVWLAHSSGVYAIPEGLVAFGMDGEGEAELPRAIAE